MGKKSKAILEAGKKLSKGKKKKTFRDVLGMWKKLLLFLLFMVYLLGGIGGAHLWSKAVRNRYLGPDELMTRIDYFRRTHDMNAALFTVSSQKDERAQEMIDMLMPYTPKIEPLFFFEIAKFYDALGNIEEAVFWHLLGSFRLNVDALCCEGMTDFDAVQIWARLNTPLSVPKFIAENNEQTKEIFERVMAWDAEHPPEASPEYFCAYAKGVLYRDNPVYTGKAHPSPVWFGIYSGYREVAIKNFDKMLQGNFNAKTDIPDTLPNQSHLQSHPMKSLKEQLESGTHIEKNGNDEDASAPQSEEQISEEQPKEQPE